jgi:hypothetical protein
LNDWLERAPVDIENAIISLRRAHSAACVADPVTALVLADMVVSARDLERRLAELTSVRGTK